MIGDAYSGSAPMGQVGPRGWPALVTAQLQRPDVPITRTVGAEDGSGYVAAGDEYGNTFADQIPRVVRPKDRLVILFGSVNDEGTSPDELNSAVRRTLADAKAAAPTAKLLVIGPPWPDSKPTAEILAVRNVLGSQAAAIGATFVDPIAEGWFVDRPELIDSDGVHPSDAGHALLAEKIAPLVAHQLQLPPPAAP
jgi:lysophospholipase L1-like esterase